MFRRRVVLFFITITTLLMVLLAQKPTRATKVADGTTKLAKRDGIEIDLEISPNDENKDISNWGTNDNNKNTNVDKEDWSIYNNNDNDNDNEYESGSKSSNNNQYQQQEKPRPAMKPQYVVESSNAYGGGPSHSGLAEGIPVSNQQTLDQIYSRQPQNAYQSAPLNLYNNDNNNIASQQNNVRQEVLLTLNFARDFAQWNPRNNNSQWKFAGSAEDPHDDAAFVVHDGGGHGYTSSSAYYNKMQSKDDSYVDLISVPFYRLDYDQGNVVSKATYAIGETQRFLARMTYTCKIVNADQNPFPSNLVTNPWDDPRLAECFFFVQGDTEDGGTIYFYFSVTNTGVWAVVERMGGASSVNGTDPGAQLFVVKRRVGVRPRYDSLVDAAVEIDQRQKVVNYYLNGYLVWKISNIGVAPPADGVNSVNLGQGTPTTSTLPNGVGIGFGTAKCLDEVDPNNQASRVRLVNEQPGSSYYGVNDTFYDNVGLRSNQLWGQGAKQRLFKLLLVRADSVLPAQIALPGVYGPPKAPAYQQQEYNQKYNNNDFYSRK